MQKQLIVTHHAPDLDAIGAVWFLKRFEPKKYADAKVAFVNPGDKLSLSEAENLGFELQNVTHVDTGLGRFDHHQEDRGLEHISASSLVHKYICDNYPEYETDQALQIISEFITEIDHFGEIYWHEAADYKYSFMIHELIRGIEFTDMHDDDSQVDFGLKCLDSAYAVLVQQVKAKEILEEKGQEFLIGKIKCVALETRNDDTIKLAQKQGFEVAIRKDPKLGNIRIKARPDSKITLRPLYDAIKEADQVGTWFYHPSGKMLINGSRKHLTQKPSPLDLETIIRLAQESLK